MTAKKTNSKPTTRSSKKQKPSAPQRFFVYIRSQSRSVQALMVAGAFAAIGVGGALTLSTQAAIVPGNTVKTCKSGSYTMSVRFGWAPTSVKGKASRARVEITGPTGKRVDARVQADGYESGVQTSTGNFWKSADFLVGSHAGVSAWAGVDGDGKEMCKVHEYYPWL